MKPDRKAAEPSAMEQRAIELSRLFEGAGWKKSSENFSDRRFVVAYPVWFTCAGYDPSGRMRAKSCKSEDEVLAFLNEPVEPPPAPETPAPVEAAAPPDPIIVERTVEVDRIIPDPADRAEIEALRARAEAAERALAEATAPPPETPEDRPQQLPPDPESARLSEYGEVGAEPMPDPLQNVLDNILADEQFASANPDLMARLRDPNPDDEARKAALMQRLIDLQGLISLGAIKDPGWAEFNQLTRYASWFK